MRRRNILPVQNRYRQVTSSVRKSKRVSCFSLFLIVLGAGYLFLSEDSKRYDVAVPPTIHRVSDMNARIGDSKYEDGEEETTFGEEDSPSSPFPENEDAQNSTDMEFANSGNEEDPISDEIANDHHEPAEIFTTNSSFFKEEEEDFIVVSDTLNETVPTLDMENTTDHIADKNNSTTKDGFFFGFGSKSNNMEANDVSNESKDNGDGDESIIETEDQQESYTSDVQDGDRDYSVTKVIDVSDEEDGANDDKETGDDNTDYTSTNTDEDNGDDTTKTDEDNDEDTAKTDEDNGDDTTNNDEGTAKTDEDNEDDAEDTTEKTNEDNDDDTAKTDEDDDDGTKKTDEDNDDDAAKTDEDNGDDMTKTNEDNDDDEKDSDSKNSDVVTGLSLNTTHAEHENFNITQNVNLDKSMESVSPLITCLSSPFAESLSESFDDIGEKADAWLENYSNSHSMIQEEVSLNASTASMMGEDVHEGANPFLRGSYRLLDQTNTEESRETNFSSSVIANCTSMSPTVPGFCNSNPTVKNECFYHVVEEEGNDDPISIRLVKETPCIINVIGLCSEDTDLEAFDLSTFELDDDEIERLNIHKDSCIAAASYKRGQALRKIEEDIMENEKKEKALVDMPVDLLYIDVDLASSLQEEEQLDYESIFPLQLVTLSLLDEDTQKPLYPMQLVLKSGDKLEEEMNKDSAQNMLLENGYIITSTILDDDLKEDMSKNTISLTRFRCSASTRYTMGGAAGFADAGIPI